MLVPWSYIVLPSFKTINSFLNSVENTHKMKIHSVFTTISSPCHTVGRRQSAACFVFYSLRGRCQTCCPLTFHCPVVGCFSTAMLTATNTKTIGNVLTRRLIFDKQFGQKQNYWQLPITLILAAAKHTHQPHQQIQPNFTGS